LDIALKQRLVGASVLVALAVIFIPMLLDGPGPDGSSAGRVPDPPDGRFETRLLPVDPAQATPAAGPSDPTTSTPVPRPTPITRSESKVIPPLPAPMELPEPVIPDSAPADQGLADSIEIPAVSDAGEWIVQLGSFGNAANAARLVDRLNQAGFHGYQEKVAVGDNTLYRVRAGYWSSKDDAAIAGTQIGNTMGDVDASVRRVTSSTIAAASLQGWMIQVGSFASRDNALSLRDQLRASGFSALVESVDDQGRASYRVRVGPEIDRVGAEAVRQRLRDELGLNGIVVTHP
jgi:DedD protein